MSLHIAAKHLASKGRGPDTHLVHMAPSEVAGLQALAKAHGGSLTINPDTGLPEAGVLSSLLPMILGAAITATTGIPAWAVGLGIGGLETARTGNLGKGIAAGLGAYGGAGLGAGMGLGASEAVAPQITTASDLAATQAAQTQNAAAAMGLPSNAAAGVGNASFTQPLSLNQVAGIAPPMAGPASTTAFTAGAEPLAQAVTSAPLSTTPAATSALDKLSAMPTSDKWRYGLAALAPAMTQQTPAQYQGSGPNPYEYTYDYKTGQYARVPTGTRDKLMQLPPMFMAGGGQVNLQGTLNVSSANSGVGPAGANGYQSAGTGFDQGPRPLDNPDGGQQQAAGGAGPYVPGPPIQAATFSDNPASSSPAPVPGYYGIGGSQADRMNAMAARQVYDQQQQATPEAIANRQRIGAMYKNLFGKDPYATMYAAGGVTQLGDYSDGGRLLKGPGDGVSDSIPATIGDKRPARLADGEFVVPARIVSELGNGSTEAGARKLYAMMDRIQKARAKTTGKERVAVNSRADKALPA